MGRPTKLTPAMQKKIVGKILKGASTETAAVTSGISRATIFTWKQKGRDGIQPYADFLSAIEEAEMSLEREAEEAFHKAFTGIDNVKLRVKKGINPVTGEFMVIEEVEEITTRVYPQFAVEWLERRRPEKWGKRSLPPLEPTDDMPDDVTAGPGYSDPWLETDEESEDDTSH